MTTEYVLRATIAVPQAHVSDANQLALCLGQSAADDQTFREAQCEDASGNLYAVCSTVAKETFPTTASSPLVAPPHAPDVDLTAAGRAQAILVVGSLDSPVTTTPDTVTAIVGDDPQGAIAAMGLTPVPSEVI